MHTTWLTLYKLNFSEGTKHICTFYEIPPHCHDTGIWNPSSSRARTYLFYIVNIMVADIVTTQGARAPASMLLTMLKRINSVLARFKFFFGVRHLLGEWEKKVCCIENLRSNGHVKIAKISSACTKVCIDTYYAERFFLLGGKICGHMNFPFRCLYLLFLCCHCTATRPPLKNILPWLSLPQVSLCFPAYHYSDVVMGAMASQITSLTIVYSTVYSGADKIKHQSSASLAFAGNSPVTGECPTQRASNAENISI